MSVGRDLVRASDGLTGTYAWKEVKISIGQEVPSPRFSHCAAMCAGKLFIFGGERKGRKLSNTMFQYDPVEKKWARQLQAQSLHMLEDTLVHRLGRELAAYGLELALRLRRWR